MFYCEILLVIKRKYKDHFFKIIVVLQSNQSGVTGTFYFGKEARSDSKGS